MDRRIKNMILYHVKVGSLDLELWIDPALTGQGLTWKVYDPLVYLHGFTVQRYGEGLWLCELPKAIAVEPCYLPKAIAVEPCLARYCNYHGQKLKFKEANRHMKFDSWDCPVRGCSVKWWGKATSLPATQVVRDARKKLYDLTQKESVSLGQCRKLSNYLWGSQLLTRAIEQDGLGIGYMNIQECQCFEKLLRGQSAESIIAEITISAPQGSKPIRPSNPPKQVAAIQSIRSINIEDLPDE